TILMLVSKFLILIFSESVNWCAHSIRLSIEEQIKNLVWATFLALGCYTKSGLFHVLNHFALPFYLVAAGPGHVVVHSLHFLLPNVCLFMPKIIGKLFWSFRVALEVGEPDARILISA
ncbi:hypothetical protein ACJX0J_033834, partial [Zea mays]